MNDFLPTNYSIPTKSNYTRFDQGETVLRILEKPIVGNELWISNKPKRYKLGQPIPMSDMNQADVDKNDGMPKPPRHFWAMVVWNYKTEQLQIWQVTQKKIMAAIEALSKSKAWGSPLEYDLSVTKEGDGFDTQYTVMPQPKTAVSKQVLEAYKQANIAITKLFTGEDPFAPRTEAEVVADEVMEGLS